MCKTRNSQGITNENSALDGDCLDATPIEGGVKQRIGVARGQELVIDSYFDSGFEKEIGVMLGIEE